MSIWRFMLMALVLLSVQQCTQNAAELHKVRAAKCLPPGDPAYDVNLGEPKCPNGLLREEPAPAASP